jgi:hypothetical protein
VVAALVGAQATKAERVHSVLAGLSEQTPEDEDAHLLKAVKALSKLSLSSELLGSVVHLAHSLEFGRIFEGILGVETGGEADYTAITSLAGIDVLKGLAVIDLDGLRDPGGKPLDLAPLLNHPSLTTLKLGPGKVKGVKALLSIPSLQRVVVPKELADPVLAQLAARNVTISHS